MSGDSLQLPLFTAGGLSYRGFRHGKDGEVRPALGAWGKYPRPYRELDEAGQVVDPELQHQAAAVGLHGLGAGAEQLGISAKTVETYRSRLMLKLGIDNLPGLVKFAIRAGILPPGA